MRMCGRPYSLLTSRLDPSQLGRPYFKTVMRRLVVLIGVVVLALPAGAGASKSGPGDGSLVVENAQGVVTLTVRGGIIGRFDQGTIEVFDPVAGDGPGPIVRGYQRVRELGPKRTQYSGEGDVRFRLIGGAYRVRISAIGLDVSAVGKGAAVLDGTGFADQPGRYSLNGDTFKPMPGVATRFILGVSLPVSTHIP
jgi:hypothetical protein